ncbi:hypothetical protein J6590_088888 [Homalodisca vitripennis]|nr:hypothetical protein J6590_088888 [Homalodisca vitripennis]
MDSDWQHDRINNVGHYVRQEKRRHKPHKCDTGAHDNQTRREISIICIPYYFLLLISSLKFKRIFLPGASPEMSSSVYSIEEGKLSPHMYGLSQGRHIPGSLVWKSTQDEYNHVTKM